MDKTLRIPTYNDCIEIIKNNDNFYSTIENVNGITIESFNYRLASYNDFNHDFARNLRGIGFNKDTKELIFLPLIKFFNYGENEFTSVENINKKNIKYITEKMDGSLIIFYVINHKLYARTQNSAISWQSENAIKIINKYPSFVNYIINMIETEHFTPVFEFISPNNRIVVKYDSESLIFIGKRNMITGEFVYANENDLISFDTDDILPVKYYSFNNVSDIYDLCRNTKKDMEGFVVLFTDGDMVKIKTEEYFKLHKLCSYLNNITNVVEIILNGTSDDVKSKFHENEGIIKTIEETEKLIIPIYNYYINEANTYYENNKELNRKEFAIKAQKSINSISFSIAMNRYTNGKIDISKYNNTFINKKLWENKN